MIKKLVEDFTDFSIFDTLVETKRLSAPLRHLCIQHFSYTEQTKDNHVRWLCNDDTLINIWQQSWENKFANSPFFSTLVQEPGNYFFEPLFSIAPSIFSDDLVRDWPMQTGIAIVEYDGDTRKTYYFACHDVDHFYASIFKQLDLFKKFSQYFKEEAKKIIQGANHLIFSEKIVNNLENLFGQHHDDTSNQHQDFLQEIGFKAQVTPIQKFSLDNQFSQRECQCLQLLLANNAVKQIAAQLQISVRTAEKHVESMRHKTGCRSIIELILKVQQHNLNP